MVIRNSSQTHAIRSIKRQRTTPWIAGMGPCSTMACRAARARGLAVDQLGRTRMRATLRRVRDVLRRHQPIPVQGRWLTQVVNGYFAYQAVPTNRRALMAFRHHVTDLWRRTLRRRSQKDRLTWARMAKLADAWLPRPHLLHPWPSERFAVRHPR